MTNLFREAAEPRRWLGDWSRRLFENHLGGNFVDSFLRVISHIRHRVGDVLCTGGLLDGWRCIGPGQQDA